MEEYEALLDKMKIFEKTYDVMRIVDPLKKKVLEVRGNKVTASDTICHVFWEKDQLCDNCISMRAFNEYDTFFKMEYKNGNVFMVTAVPVKVKGQPVVVELLKNTSKSMLLGEKDSDGDVRILTMIDFVGQVAVRDPLTQLYNRRYIDERLPVEILNASLQNNPLSVIFADIDFFKKINDTYGHSAGDSVLRELSKALEGFMRKGRDWVARFGGEEFFICLPGSDLDAAREAAEKIRSGIEKMEFTAEDQRIRLTCSFGVHAICNGNECTTADSVIRMVDKHLYRAKNLGRNRIE